MLSPFKHFSFLYSLSRHKRWFPWKVSHLDTLPVTFREKNLQLKTKTKTKKAIISIPTSRAGGVRYLLLEATILNFRH